MERHYLRYLKYTNQESLLKAYFIQNKRFEDLGYEAIKRELTVSDGGGEHLHPSNSYNSKSVEILKSKVN